MDETFLGNVFFKLWITRQDYAEFLTFRAESLTYSAEFLTLLAEFLTFHFSYDIENSAHSQFFSSGTP